jgi:hypothetical protein
VCIITCVFFTFTKPKATCDTKQRSSPASPCNGNAWRPPASTLTYPCGNRVCICSCRTRRTPSCGMGRQGYCRGRCLRQGASRDEDRMRVRRPLHPLCLWHKTFFMFWHSNISAHIPEHHHFPSTQRDGQHALDRYIGCLTRTVPTIWERRRELT